MNKYPTYSVSIRTLGTAGKKYQETLNSVARQTVKPEKVLVYIPHGYALPKETIGVEEYVRCDKGMVTQRSQPFDEITSEYILFLDDDLSFEANFVQKLFDGLLSMDGDCISPDIYRCHENSWLIKMRDYLGGTKPHFDSKWAFKIRRDTHYSYNYNPKFSVLLSQSGTGACCLCKKSAYKAIHFEDERWMDRANFGLGEDQLFYYKLFKYEYRVLTSFDAKVIHLNAGAGHEKNNERMSYSCGFCRYAIWRRTIFDLQPSKLQRFLCRSALFLDTIRSFPLNVAIMLKYLSVSQFKAQQKGRKAAEDFLETEEYLFYPSYLAHKQHK